MKCRIGCGACCIALSISEGMPNHPNGKKAGEICKNMNEDKTCSIWDTKSYPKTCGKFQAEKSWCGDNFNNAIEILTDLESKM